MKPLSRKFAAILLSMCLIIVLEYSKTEAANWKFLGTTELGHCYYDEDNITFPSNRTVRVWERIVTDDDLKKAFEEKKEAIQKSIKERASGKEIISEKEFDKLYDQMQREFFKDLILPEKRIQTEIKCGDKVFRVSRVEHRRSKFRLRTFRFQPFRLLVPKSLKPYPCFLCPL